MQHEIQTKVGFFQVKGFGVVFAEGKNSKLTVLECSIKLGLIVVGINTSEIIDFVYRT